MDYIRKYWHILVSIICVIVLGFIYLGDDNNPAPEIERTPITTINTPNPEILEIKVHIVGEVKQPGVLTLPSGSRVNDALELAGGPTDQADLSKINLAAFLSDAQQIIVPTEGEETGFSNLGDSTSTLININTADIQGLMTLPGVGSVLASNIIEHRNTNGQFKTIEDLKNVPRIGESTFDRLRNLIKV